MAGVAAYIYYIRRSRRPRQPPGLHPYGFSSGISYRDISPGKASSIDSWRKNATANIPPTPSSGSGSGSGSSVSGLHFYAAHVQPGSGRFIQSVSPGRSPPPDYPDYLPYRGPIEPRPTTPPLIAGINASTQGWLAATAATSLSPSPLDRSQARGTRSIHRPDPIPLRERYTAELDEVPWDSYYAQQDVISPASTLSSLGLTGMTSRAMGATRSVARLWPTSIVVDSHPPPFTPQSAPTTTIPSRPTRPLRVSSYDTNPSVPSYTSTANPSVSHNQSVDPTSGSTVNSTGTFRAEQVGSKMTSPVMSLRRGVSIKSVKTMRSFFSGLLFANSPIPNTPAIPSTYMSDRFEVARPESEIFPSGSVSRAGSIVRAEQPDRLDGTDRVDRLIHCGYPGYASMGLGLGLGLSVSSANYTGTAESSGGSTPRGHQDQKDASHSRDSRRREDTARLERASSATSHGLPPIRLDRGGDNFFIELNPNSPVTMVNGSRPGSEMTSAPTSWRYV